MFLDELTPIVKELIQQPIAFLGGFCSGVLRISLSDDPVKTWLQKQTGSTYTVPTSSTDNGKSNGPQSILIE
ncbi:hypothetical protein [Limnofasciculus baicalensis]|uniref:Uncharacterized protein n=1 Tax=Limnofasciculus baicalensis BBK-W-15 TaxID=2699891 RepID=A0AAE3GXA6_9CYAN|nr:hypothetical protein [Limnofasciculus baicalensis]MCP2731511.1 hypothetical protein [Limnofasciculus baicalensis BBK-W-15]